MFQTFGKSVTFYIYMFLYHYGLKIAVESVILVQMLYTVTKRQQEESVCSYEFPQVLFVTFYMFQTFSKSATFYVHMFLYHYGLKIVVESVLLVQMLYASKR